MTGAICPCPEARVGGADHVHGRRDFCRIFRSLRRPVHGARLPIFVMSSSLRTWTPPAILYATVLAVAPDLLLNMTAIVLRSRMSARLAGRG